MLFIAAKWGVNSVYDYKTVKNNSTTANYFKFEKVIFFN